MIRAQGSGDVLFDVNVTEPEYCTETLERGKRYRRQVFAVNAYGETRSQEQIFRVQNGN